MILPFLSPGKFEEFETTDSFFPGINRFKFLVSHACILKLYSKIVLVIAVSCLAQVRTLQNEVIASSRLGLG